jgi:hypothetical protein
MGACLMIYLVTKMLQSLDQFSSRQHRQFGQELYLYDCFHNGRGDGFIVLAEAFQIAGDCILDVLQSLVVGLALGNTSGKAGHLCNKDAILILPNDYAIFHSIIVTLFIQ